MDEVFEIGDAVCVVDAELRVVRVNEAHERVTGKRREETRGRTLWSIWPEAADPSVRFRTEYERCLRDRVVVEFEEHVASRDLWTSIRAVPLPSGGMAIFHRNISEQRRAEGASRTSDERFRLLIAHAPTAIAMFDRDMRYLAHSRRFTEDYKLPPESLVGRSHYDVFPEIPERWREIHRRCLAGASERCDAERFERADGTVEWLRWEIVPWYERDGAIGGIVLFSEDLTSLKAAEKALAEQRQLLTSIVDGTPSLIVAFDADGRIFFVNEAAAQFHGRPKESFFGKTALTALDPRDAARVLAAHKAVLEHGHTVSAEHSIELAGTTRHVLATRYPLRDTNGRAYGTATVATDITAQKRAEAEARASEARTREALVALEKAQEAARRTEERLRQAQKMEAIGQLAGGVAHDFNNILTVILGGADQLSQVLHPGDPAREDLIEIKNAGLRAAALTRQLLAFSRKQLLEPRVVDLNELVRGSERMFQRLISEDIDLALALTPKVEPCLLDPGQVEQVRLNLVVNARDAMPDGGHILIETANVVLDAAYAADHPEVKPGAYVRLTVTDTGVGMSPEVRARLFEPFFTTKEVGRGTGLGLSTVYGIVRQSGGHIWVYSEPDRGTVFKVYFPVTASSSVPVGASVHPAVVRRGKETVLLVEDDPHVRGAVGSMLRRAGYHVIPAANGGEALLICEQHGGNIDLLLTDVVMPKLNGRKVAERLRQIRPGLRVIFMSGYTENAIVHHGVLDSGLDFLAKPITSEALLVKVREVLDRSAS